MKVVVRVKSQIYDAVGPEKEKEKAEKGYSTIAPGYFGSLKLVSL